MFDNEKKLKYLGALSPYVNDRILYTGREYFNYGAVQCSKVENNSVKARVSGTNNYEVAISMRNLQNISKKNKLIYISTEKLKEESENFKEKTPYIEYNCTCPYYKINEGMVCKHVVATLFAIDYEKIEERSYTKKEIEEQKIKKKQEAEKVLLNKLLNINPEKQEQHLLYLIGELNFCSARSSSSKGQIVMNLEIGSLENKKKYKLTNKIRKFLEAYENMNFLFGKELEYDPLKHYFDKKDNRIIEILKSIEDMDMYGDNYYNNYYNRNYEYGYFKKDGIVIPKIFAKDILELVVGNKLKKTEYTFNYSVTKIKDEIVIKSEDLEKILILYDVAILKRADGISENKESFYLMPKEKIEPIRELQQLIGYKEARFSCDSQKLADVMNQLNKYGNCIVNDEIKKMIIVPTEVKTDLYLEKHSDFAIKIRPEVLYDNKKIQEFDIPILRNHEKEKEVFLLLKEIGFEKYENNFFMSEDEKIYKFMTEDVKKLTEKYNVFYSEELKKMKFNKFNLNVSVKMNDIGLLEFTFNSEGIDSSDLKVYFQALKEKRKFLKLKNGSVLYIESENFKEIEDVFSVLNPNSSELLNGVVKREAYYSYFVEKRLENLKNVKIDENIVVSSAEIENKNLENIELKNFSMLRDYQKYGIQWLLKLNTLKLGGILADDMGLGKTLQTIAYLSTIIENQNEGSRGSHIIIAPKSLVYNWKHEFEKFAPNLNIKILAGSKKEREKELDDICHGDILITSYGVLQKDQQLYENIVFETIVIDEAQAIKNPFSKNSDCVKNLKGKTKIALTGTPIENNLLELWSIFEFVLPGYLGKLEKFREEYISNNKNERLKILVHPFILRRLKKDVLKELPDKIETDIIVELNEKQKKVYLSYLGQIKKELLADGEEDGENNQMKILSVITRLRQICLHPKIFIEDYSDESAKLELLLELIDEYKEAGHRMLIFSQFTEMLGIIKAALGKKYNYLYLDGKTSSIDRVKMTDEFNKGNHDLFLISLKAGGAGLNLTGADVVIHFDPWWNPAVEDQATDRAYRIGQDKKVQVIKLITAGTIEEKIAILKEKKKQLTTEILDGNEASIFKLSKAELLNLLES